jgi:hypothetical protein
LHGAKLPTGYLTKCKCLVLLVKLLVPAADRVLMYLPSQLEHTRQKNKMDDKDEPGKEKKDDDIKPVEISEVVGIK